MFQFIANFTLIKKHQLMPRLGAPGTLDLSKPERILIIAPHPDDDILGCGGTIAKLVQTANVCVVLVTDGCGAGELPFGTDAVRKVEFESALNLLGVNNVMFLNQPDGFFKPNNKLRRKVVEILMGFEPDWIFLPSRFDYHRDHVLISEFVFNTAVAVFKSYSPKLIEYETSAPIQATHLVDITDVFNLKIAALSKHETALACGDYLRAITGLNAYRGLYLGLNKFGEAFKVINLISVPLLLRVQGAYWRFRYNWQRRGSK